MELENKVKILIVPILPLRDVVVYPHMVLPLFVGREKSIRGLEVALSSNKQIFLVAQKQPAVDDPKVDDIFKIGTISNILQLLRLPDGTIKVLIEGVARAEIIRIIDGGAFYSAETKLLEDTLLNPVEAEALKRAMFSGFDQYVRLNKRIPPEILATLSGIEEPGRLADTIAAHLTIKLQDRQTILEITDVCRRLEKIMAFIEGEIDLLQVEKRVRGRVKKQMEKSQREYYLNEQMKAIQKELGEVEGQSETDELAAAIKKAGMPKEVRKKTEGELKKLKLMPPMSSEATVVRNYIDCLLNVPWKKRTQIHHDLNEAEKVLEADHYGLEKVKERILEYLAVLQRVKKMKGPILCLVGPPGVGKTSLGQSIARATHRKFVRVSLGGVRDEAEIRGHRRTYIGSLPGKIIQKLTKVGVRNPLFLLDEIDKMSADFRGDPASALLEVLDPEQNNTFNDHYLEVDYDLSEVMFVTTANSTTNIPMPLLDRMEVIRIPGYIEDEKIKIAQRYLIPKQVEKNGLKEHEVEITEDAIRDIVRYYTREAGVRNLEREISKICRKVVRNILKKHEEPAKRKVIKTKRLERYLGAQRFRFGVGQEQDRVGQVTGLAWTEVGGELLTIEAVALAGKGETICTGQLGNVMQESIKAAMTVVRSRSSALHIPKHFYEKLDIHVHVPEGATPKDGPSAGIGMCTALASALTQTPVRSDVAMTGEITLRGEVLPIGGLKEKLLAARRGGIKHVIIPTENAKELKEISSHVIGDLEIHPVQWIDEVFTLALKPMPAGEKTLLQGDLHEEPAMPPPGIPPQHPEAPPPPVIPH